MSESEIFASVLALILMVICYFGGYVNGIGKAYKDIHKKRERGI